MWIQLCRRERYADGAGKVSRPVVVYVRTFAEKGSERSGLEGAREALDAVGGGKGPLERRRMAWVIVGWKRPP